jgi:hypothetical protein
MLNVVMLSVMAPRQDPLSTTKNINTLVKHASLSQKIANSGSKKFCGADTWKLVEKHSLKLPGIQKQKC